MSSKQITLITANIGWLRNYFLTLPFIYLENYYYDCYNNYFLSSIWCVHVLTIKPCIPKQVSFYYLHVICGLEEKILLDWFKSGNSKGFFIGWKIKLFGIFSNTDLTKSLLSYIFLAFSPCYVNYFVWHVFHTLREHIRRKVIVSVDRSSVSIDRLYEGINNAQ